jgi:hypothetical protein
MEIFKEKNQEIFKANLRLVEKDNIARIIPINNDQIFICKYKCNTVIPPFPVTSNFHARFSWTNIKNICSNCIFIFTGS